MTKEQSMPAAPAPPSFTEKMSIPTTDFRTAVAIRNDTRTTEVTVTFLLKAQNGASAAYVSTCPRCQVGVIKVEVSLAHEGRLSTAT